MDNIKAKATPFLKWAGGKRWLVNRYGNALKFNYNRYFEPFVGSGAMFFHIAPSSGVISDSNNELIETYNAIKENWKSVYTYLKKHDTKHSKDYYYHIRTKKYKLPEKKAAQFIYLNRTCWNGLYRVNKKNEFNVPIGTKKRAVFDTDDFGLIKKILDRVEILSCDFENTIKMSKENDFLFIDPPYTVKHNNNNFIKYNQSIFSWEDQERLALCVKQASHSGVKIMLTNACSKFVKQLYEDFYSYELSRSSVLSGKPQYRRECRELLISNFELKLI